MKVLATLTVLNMLCSHSHPSMCQSAVSWCKGIQAEPAGPPLLYNKVMPSALARWTLQGCEGEAIAC